MMALSSTAASGPTVCTSSTTNNAKCNTSSSNPIVTTRSKDNHSNNNKSKLLSMDSSETFNSARSNDSYDGNMNNNLMNDPLLPQHHQQQQEQHQHPHQQQVQPKRSTTAPLNAEIATSENVGVFRPRGEAMSEAGSSRSTRITLSSNSPTKQQQQQQQQQQKLPRQQQQQQQRHRPKEKEQQQQQQQQEQQQHEDLNNACDMKDSMDKSTTATISGRIRKQQDNNNTASSDRGVSSGGKKVPIVVHNKIIPSKAETLTIGSQKSSPRKNRINTISSTSHATRDNTAEIKKKVNAYANTTTITKTKTVVDEGSTTPVLVRARRRVPGSSSSVPKNSAISRTKSLPLGVLECSIDDSSINTSTINSNNNNVNNASIASGSPSGTTVLRRRVRNQSARVSSSAAVTASSNGKSTTSTRTRRTKNLLDVQQGNVSEDDDRSYDDDYNNNNNNNNINFDGSGRGRSADRFIGNSTNSRSSTKSRRDRTESYDSLDESFLIQIMNTSHSKMDAYSDMIPMNGNGNGIARRRAQRRRLPQEQQSQLQTHQHSASTPISSPTKNGTDTTTTTTTNRYIDVSSNMNNKFSNGNSSNNNNNSNTNNTSNGINGSTHTNGTSTTAIINGGTSPTIATADSYGGTSNLNHLDNHDYNNINTSNNNNYNTTMLSTGTGGDSGARENYNHHTTKMSASKQVNGGSGTSVPTKSQLVSPSSFTRRKMRHLRGYGNTSSSTSSTGGSDGGFFSSFLFFILQSTSTTATTTTNSSQRRRRLNRYYKRLYTTKNFIIILTFVFITSFSIAYMSTRYKSSSSSSSTGGGTATTHGRSSSSIAISPMMKALFPSRIITPSYLRTKTLSKTDLMNHNNNNHSLHKFSSNYQLRKEWKQQPPKQRTQLHSTTNQTRNNDNNDMIMNMNITNEKYIQKLRREQRQEYQDIHMNTAEDYNDVGARSAIRRHSDNNQKKEAKENYGMNRKGDIDSDGDDEKDKAEHDTIPTGSRSNEKDTMFHLQHQNNTSKDTPPRLRGSVKAGQNDNINGNNITNGMLVVGGISSSLRGRSQRGPGIDNIALQASVSGQQQRIPKFQLHSEHAPQCTPVQPDDIAYTLVTQMSLNRLWMMEYHCARWFQDPAEMFPSSASLPHPISISVYLGNGTDIDGTITDVEWIQNELRQMGCPVRDDEDPTRVQNAVTVQTLTGYSDAEYPVNVLRNLALQAVETSHVVYVDVDFWVSTDLHDTLMQTKHRTFLSTHQKSVLVIPAFQLMRQCKEYKDCRTKNIPRMPHDQEELLSLMIRKRATPFDPTNIGGHGSTRYRDWVEQSRDELLPITCVRSNRYEPYVVFRYCHDMPPFQEAFSGYGKNKMTWMMHLLQVGYDLHQIGRSFVVHYPHLESLARLKWNGDEVYEGGHTPSSRNKKKHNSHVELQQQQQQQQQLKRQEIDETFVHFRTWLAGIGSPDTNSSQRVVPKCAENSLNDDAKLRIDRTINY